jgi:hypothetical protein
MNREKDAMYRLQFEYLDSLEGQFNDEYTYEMFEELTITVFEQLDVINIMLPDEAVGEFNELVTMATVAIFEAAPIEVHFNVLQLFKIRLDTMFENIEW